MFRKSSLALTICLFVLLVSWTSAFAQDPTPYTLTRTPSPSATNSPIAGFTPAPLSPVPIMSPVPRLTITGGTITNNHTTDLAVSITLSDNRQFYGGCQVRMPFQFQEWEMSLEAPNPKYPEPNLQNVSSVWINSGWVELALETPRMFARAGGYDWYMVCTFQPIGATPYPEYKPLTGMYGETGPSGPSGPTGGDYITPEPSGPSANDYLLQDYLNNNQFADMVTPTATETPSAVASTTPTEISGDMVDAILAGMETGIESSAMDALIAGMNPVPEGFCIVERVGTKIMIPMSADGCNSYGSPDGPDGFFFEAYNPLKNPYTFINNLNQSWFASNPGARQIPTAVIAMFKQVGELAVKMGTLRAACDEFERQLSSKGQADLLRAWLMARHATGGDICGK